jgi:hypothetical protein
LRYGMGDAEQQQNCQSCPPARPKQHQEMHCDPA